MKKIIFTLFIAFSSVVVNAQDQKVVIMSTAQCDECKEKIESALNFEKGVKSSNVNIETKEVTIVYNPSKTTPDKLRKAISMVGYDADSIPADAKAYARLKPCCTKDGHKHE